MTLHSTTGNLFYVAPNYRRPWSQEGHRGNGENLLHINIVFWWLQRRLNQRHLSNQSHFSRYDCLGHELCLKRKRAWTLNSNSSDYCIVVFPFPEIYSIYSHVSFIRSLIIHFYLGNSQFCVCVNNFTFPHTVWWTNWQDSIDMWLMFYVSHIVLCQPYCFMSTTLLGFSRSCVLEEIINTTIKQ